MGCIWPPGRSLVPAVNRTETNRKKKHSCVLERVSVITSGSPSAAALPHSTLRDRVTPNWIKFPPGATRPYLQQVPWQRQQKCHLKAFSPVLHHQQRPAGTDRKAQRPQIAQSMPDQWEGIKCAAKQFCGSLWKWRALSDLVDTRVSFRLFLWGSVQAPQGGEPALALAAGSRHGLRPTPHSHLRPSCHLRRQDSGQFNLRFTLAAAWMSRLVTMEVRGPTWLLHPAASTSIWATAALRWRRTTSISLIRQCRGEKKSNRCFFFFSLSVPVVLLAVVHVTPALRGSKFNESLVRDPGSRIEFSREADVALFYYIFPLNAF